MSLLTSSHFPLIFISCWDWFHTSGEKSPLIGWDFDLLYFPLQSSKFIWSPWMPGKRIKHCGMFYMVIRRDQTAVECCLLLTLKWALFHTEDVDLNKLLLTPYTSLMRWTVCHMSLTPYNARFQEFGRRQYQALHLGDKAWSCCVTQRVPGLLGATQSWRHHPRRFGQGPPVKVALMKPFLASSTTLESTASQLLRARQATVGIVHFCSSSFSGSEVFPYFFRMSFLSHLHVCGWPVPFHLIVECAHVGNFSRALQTFCAVHSTWSRSSWRVSCVHE